MNPVVIEHVDGAHVGFVLFGHDIDEAVLGSDIDRVVGHHSGGLYGDGRAWIVWPAPEYELVIRPEEWNEYLLKVEGNRYVSRLNGVPMVDFTDPTPKSFDGYISLQLHSGGLGNMRFKDIYIRDLTKR